MVGELEDAKGRFVLERQKQFKDSASASRVGRRRRRRWESEGTHILSTTGGVEVIFF